MERIRPVSPAITTASTNATDPARPTPKAGTAKKSGAAGELGGLPKRTSLAHMPREISSAIFDKLSGRDAWSVGRSSRAMHGAVLPHLDRARLTSNAGTAPTLEELHALLGSLEATRADLDSQKRPDVISDLRDSLRDEPYAAAATRLKEIVTSRQENDPATHARNFETAWKILNALPVGHRALPLAVLAYMTQQFALDDRAQVFDRVLDEIVKQPLEVQIMSLNGLVHTLQHLPKSDIVTNRFKALLDQATRHAPDNRIFLLDNLIKQIGYLPSTDKKKAYDALIDDFEKLPVGTPGEQESLRTLYKRTIVFLDVALPVADSTLGSGDTAEVMLRLMKLVPRLPEASRLQDKNAVRLSMLRLNMGDFQRIEAAIASLD